MYTQGERGTEQGTPADLRAPDIQARGVLGQTSPPLSRRPLSERRRQMLIGAVIVALVVLLISGVVFIPGVIRPRQPTPTPTTGAQACPAGPASPAYWEALVGANGRDRLVQGVSCAPIVGASSLQALVLVRHTDASSTLDVFVFDEISSAHPTRLFSLLEPGAG